MNFDQILEEVLRIADFPQERKDQFVKAFYGDFYSQLIDEIAKVDNQASEQLSQLLTNNDEFNKKLEDLSKNLTIAEKIDLVIEQEFGALVDDISKYATEDQKQKILAVLPQ